jgi:protein-disulfide isomerase
MGDSAGANVGYLQLPLKAIHPLAEGAARSAICAEEQGYFHEMHALLMRTSTWQDDSNWAQLALQAGVPDTVRYLKCRATVRVSERLMAVAAYAESLQVVGTPTLYSQMGRINGELTAETLRALALRHKR